MSLLLEALKRAEKAKEDAQRRAAQEAAPAAKEELRLADDATVPPPARRVVTRENLPDISQPLEILSGDLDRGPAAAAGPAAATASARPAGERAPRPHPQPDAQQEARASARRLFETSYRAPDPRLPFYITLGVLGAVAISAGAYFWYQLRPPAPLVYAHPARPANERPVEEASTRAPAPPPAAAAPAPIPAERPAPAAVARNPAARPPRRAEPRAPARAAPARPRRHARAAAPVAPRQAVAPAADATASVRVHRAQPQIPPQVAAGYAAYRAGDMDAARAAYSAALRDEPGNRDALLGLASVEARTGRPERAAQLYRRVLVDDPRNPYAEAGLVALRGSAADPTTSESRLKNLISADPDAQVLYLSLGNQYASQGRWGEARQAYLRALAADPGNADIAYNLAVSLDRLHQPKLALDYYRKALALAARGGAGFDREAAARRVRELAP